MEQKKSKRPVTEEQMKLRLASLCARSEQCEYDIAEKLRRSGLDAEACRRIFATLREGRFVDNARFARSFARYKAEYCGWGRQKIIAGLMAKRIPSSLITKALESLDDDIFDAPLMKAARAKARTLDLTQYTDRMKLMRHLLSRGYTSDEARHALANLQQ